MLFILKESQWSLSILHFDMKKFISRLTIFFILIFFILGISIVVFYNLTRNTFLGKNNISVLVLGDSHSQNGIDIESKLNNSLNLSNSAESYYFCDQKLQYYFKRKTKIDKVVLAFGPHSLTKSLDTIWLFDKLNFIEKARTYWPILDYLSVHEYFAKVNFSSFTYLELVPELLFQACYTIERRLLLRKSPFLGGFSENNNSIMLVGKDSTNEVKSSSKDPEVSDIQIFYLNRIIQRCNAENVKLVLVNTPLFNGGELKDLSKLQGTYSVLDYGNLFEGKADCFADYVHLNKHGANCFSDTLLVRLSKM